MLFSGISNNNERINFGMADCPVHISTKEVVLAAKRCSPIINAKSIVRGDETLNIFEGDEIYENDELLGIVVYAGGFALQTVQGKIKSLPHGEHIKVKEFNKESLEVLSRCKRRTPFLFSADGFTFNLTGIAYKVDEYIIVTNEDYHKKIIPNSIREYTGLKSGDQELFYGDAFNDGFVVLQKGKPSLEKGNKITPLYKILNKEVNV